MTLAVKKLLHAPSVKPGVALSDILEITNLITDDNGVCTYLHRSIREFHAAAFLSKISDAEASRFYGRVVEKWRSWSGVLDFLEHLDERRFLDMFRVPDINQIGEISELNVLGSYRQITLERVSERLLRVSFSNSVSKTIDEHLLSTVLDDYEPKIRHVYAPKIADRIIDSLANVSFVRTGFANGLAELPNPQTIFSLCENLKLEHVVDLVQDYLSRASDFQTRESEFDV